MMELLQRVIRTVRGEEPLDYEDSKRLAASWVTVFALQTALYAVGTAFIVLLMVKDHSVGIYRTAASTDYLTGLLNRRACFEELGRRLEFSNAKHWPGALIYLDLDNFKVLNDRAGHGAGDEVLRTFAQILRQNTRGDDVAARIGGDEFVVWIDGIGPEVAETRARAILEGFRALVPTTGDAQRPLSVSMGLALYAPQSREAPEALVARADRAMYAAKQAGRGQLRYATAPAPREGALTA